MINDVLEISNNTHTPRSPCIEEVFLLRCDQEMSRRRLDFPITLTVSFVMTCERRRAWSLLHLQKIHSAAGTQMSQMKMLPWQ